MTNLATLTLYKYDYSMPLNVESMNNTSNEQAQASSENWWPRLSEREEYRPTTVLGCYARRPLKSKSYQEMCN